MTTELKIKTPKHLQKAGKKFWAEIVGSYQLEPHHQQLLARACAFLDAIDESQKSLELAGGSFYDDRFGQPKVRPEVAVMRDSTIGFTRVLRELNLDADMVPASASRPPLLARNQYHVA